MSKRHRTLRSALLFLLVLCLTAAAYYPGLSGPAILDDYPHLAKFVGDTWQWSIIKNNLFVSSLGENARALSMLSFAVNAYAFHKSFFILKLMNLLIHLLNGYLLYQLSRAILRQPRACPQKWDRKTGEWIAFFAASLWVIHPMLVSSVLYGIQRMTLMASLFTLLGLLWYTHFRLKFETATRSRQAFYLCLLHFCALCAVLSKESGVLLYGYLFALELTVYQQPKRPQAVAWLQWLSIGLPIFTILVYFTYRLKNYFLFYLARDFTLPERLMTESHVLFDYLRAMIFPNLGSMRFYTDDVTIIHQLDPVTLIFCLFWLTFAVLPLFIFRKWPILAFCMMWFTVSHILESTFLPLELSFIHRNYLALFSVSLSVSYFGTMIFKRCFSPRFYCAIFSMLFLSMGCITQSYSFIWSDEDLLNAFMLVTTPDSYRANSTFVAMLTADKQYPRALTYVEKLIARYPNDPGAYLERIRIEACYQHAPIPKWQWQALYQSGHTMQDVANFRFFIQRFLGTINSGECKGFDAKPLMPFLSVIEQNKAFSGFPKPYYQTAMIELNQYKALLGELTGDYPNVMLGYRTMFSLEPRVYTPLVRLFHFQMQHHYDKDAQFTLDNLIKAYEIQDHLPLPPWLLELQAQMSTISTKI